MPESIFQTRLSPGAIAATRKACQCHQDADPEYMPRDDAGWESCLEYWELEGADQWCRGCVESVVVAALTSEEVDCLTERRWVGNGPSVEEAGGETILARFEDGTLRMLEWAFDGWFDERGDRIPGDMASWSPTGWRRMPCLTTTNG